MVLPGAHVGQHVGEEDVYGCAGCGVKATRADAEGLVYDQRGRYWHMRCVAVALGQRARPEQGPFTLGNACPQCGGDAECSVPLDKLRNVPQHWELKCGQGHRFMVQRIKV